MKGGVITKPQTLGYQHMKFSHQPVMVNEVVDLFAPVPPGLLIDATLGGGGHSQALLKAHSHLQILGLDRDQDAISAVRKSLGDFGNRLTATKARFDEMQTLKSKIFPSTPVVGVLFDLGVSSPQLDWEERGFSYRLSGPLDMRMDKAEALDADEVVNGYQEHALVGVLRAGGEDKFARRIARAIVASRPIGNTGQLAEVIRSAIPAPARQRRGDPAKRSFQAIRIEVNQEIELLDKALSQALELVVPKGRIAILSYHSGEDRFVKQRFVEASTGGCSCPPNLGCVCGATPRFHLLNRGARKPSAVELQENSRAKPARFRAIEARDLNTYTDSNQLKDVAK